MPVPAMLVVAPTHITFLRGEFAGGGVTSAGFAEVLRYISAKADNEFFDANPIETNSQIDDVHLTVSQHRKPWTRY